MEKTKKLGIIELSAVVVSSLEIQKTFSKVFEDKRFTIDEIIEVVPVFNHAQDIVKKAPDALEQMKDLDDEEKLQIFAQIEKFDIPDDRKEEKIEKAIKFAVNVADFVFDMQD